MAKYILRLDDASDYMDIGKWERMTSLLDKYSIKPIFGIIPQNKDESCVGRYKLNHDFWKWVHQRRAKGWAPAMHGYEHRYVTTNGGINPVNKRSEFAGLSYEEQCGKIRAGYAILKEHGIQPEIFFAPSHTFDENTLQAIKDTTPIRVISDTIAYDVYKEGEFWFIPQQSGRVRKLLFSLVTFCYHPNTMRDEDFMELENFILNYGNKFIDYKRMILKDRKLNLIDRGFRCLYFIRKRS